MKLGIHAYAWCSQWTNDTLSLIDRVADLGLDFIEIPLMCLDTYDAAAIKARLDATGLGAVTSTVLLADTDITSDDPVVREQGRRYLEDCVRATAAIGATSFSGVIYAKHVGLLERRPEEVHWTRSADGLRPAARLAGDLGVSVGIEPVNRYETFLVNTCAQARELMQRIGEPAVKIHLDTYHMNIEEKSFETATLEAGSDLIHYHLCENDRGIPGTGLVDWDGIFRALKAIDYRGNAALESFVDNTDNMSTWVWRQLAPDGDTLLRDGVRFIREKQKQYGLA